MESMFRKETLRRWGRLIAEFSVGQGASMIIRMLAGILLVRWMTKDDYAMFTLVLAFQGTTAVLVDLGISRGLVALIANRCDDPTVVGRYIGAVKHYRNRLITLGAACLVFVFMVAGAKYGWGRSLSICLWAIVVLSLWFDAQCSFYSPVLELKQRIKELYTIEVITSFIRITLLAVAWVFHFITAPVALAIGVVQSVLFARFLRKEASPFIKKPEPNDPLQKEKKETLDLALPKVTGSVFFAVQGQLTFFLVGIFGSYTQIADLGALTKIAILFTTPIAFTEMLILPWFSKIKTSRVFKSYVGVLSVYAAIGGLLITSVWFAPQVFLFILGDGYQNLGREIFLFSICASLDLVEGTSHALTSTRKWVYYWFGPASIMIYVGLLIVFLLFVDLSSISNVIMLSIMTSVCFLVMNQVVFVNGYLKEKKAQRQSE